MVLAVNPHSPAEPDFRTKTSRFYNSNLPVLQPKLKIAEGFALPPPSINNKVKGRLWDGWRGEFLPFIFCHLSCTCRMFPAWWAAPRRAPAPAHPPLWSHPLWGQGGMGARETTLLCQTFTPQTVLRLNGKALFITSEMLCCN